MSRGNPADLDELLAPDIVLVLPGGLERHGRPAVREWIQAVLTPAAVANDIRFELARTRACTAVLHDVGMLLTQRPGESQRGWHVAMHWRNNDGRLVLSEARVYTAGDFTGYDRPCAPLPDSIFRSRHNTVTLTSAAAALVSSRLTNSFAEGLRNVGWAAPLHEVLLDGQSYLTPGSERVTRRRPVVGSVQVRRQMAGAFFLSLSGVWGGGYLERSDAATQATASLQYGTIMVALQPGLSLGWVHASGGPAVVRVSGTWHTRSMLGAGSPPADEDWGDTQVGMRAALGVLIPVNPRFGLALDGYYGKFPDTRIAPYLDMEAANVSLNDAGVSAGIAVRF